MCSTRTALAVALIGSSFLMPIGRSGASAQGIATPSAGYSCETSSGAATPAHASGDIAAHAATPAPGMGHSAMDLDQMYIDMMIPHHASIIAMAETALPRLQDERLQQMASAIVATQGPEIAELRRHREAFYGDTGPMPMDETIMAAMDMLMPGMSGTVAEMAFQMDADAQVAAICAAENADLAFIEQTIPHHQMAIEASKAVLAQSGHPEIRAIAERVIVAQQREIEELGRIQESIAASASPRSS